MHPVSSTGGLQADVRAQPGGREYPFGAAAFQEV